MCHGIKAAVIASREEAFSFFSGLVMILVWRRADPLQGWSVSLKSLANCFASNAL